MALRVGAIVQSPESGQRFKLVEVIGRGGYGVAFRATRVGPKGRRSGTDVCIKVTTDQQSWHREAYFGNLLEGKTGAIEIFETFVVSPSTFVVASELAENGSLASFLESNPRPWSERRIVKEMVSIANALNALHQGGAAHRDVTPFNILVTTNGSLKLADFGISTHWIRPRGAIADIMNRGWVDAQLKDGERVHWDAGDDIWQLGQILGLLLRWCDGDALDLRPMRTGFVRQMQSSAELKVVLRRSIGHRSHRYRNGAEFVAALARPTPIRFGGVRTLNGRQIVFTGPLSIRRDIAARKARRAGAEVANSVSALTDVVVVGRQSANFIADDRGLKLIEAGALRDRGTPIKYINEEQFLRLVQRE